jgi:hypothetical protein
MPAPMLVKISKSKVFSVFSEKNSNITSDVNLFFKKYIVEIDPMLHSMRLENHALTVKHILYFKILFW